MSTRVDKIRDDAQGDGMSDDQWEDDSSEVIDQAEIESTDDDDEIAALRGTSQCDGLCDPQCDWCLVAHYCPDECAGGPCPYDALGEGPMRAISNADTFESRRIRIDTSVRHECSSACAHLDRGEV